MLFGRLRIQSKLALLVLVPLLGVVALAGPIVLNRIGVAEQARRTAESVALADRVGSLLQEMQQERLLGVGYLLGVVERSRLDLQSAEVVDWVTDLSNGIDVPVPAALVAALRSARSLDSTRAAVIERRIGADQLINEYATVITPIIDGVGLREKADLTTSTGRQVLALDSVLRADDGVSQAMSMLVVAVHTRNSQQAIQVSQKFSQLQAEQQRFKSFGTADQVQLYVDVQSSFTARAGANFLETLTLDPELAAKGLTVPTLFPSVESIGALGRFIEKKITTDVTTAVNEGRTRATNLAYAVSAVALLLVLLVVGLSLVMARAVARPLRHLTTSAERIARAAEEELQRVADDDAESTRPVRLDAVDVQARDEIGDLARAFERVQTTAAQLVERQVASRRNVAQMFGHVGRRTQNLVSRQLALIDQLERQETEASRLRDLYRLDHMSSRLRRNASSLVVLSGGAGTDDYTAPMPLSDVVRLALGEIEDYPRVDVNVPEDVVVVPSLVADLTLLLAELMENATSFSPPHTRVTVAATSADDRIQLAVVDHGLGLPDGRLDDENSRLTHRERLDLAPTEVLGLFVVGRLARRHELDVSLHQTPGGGLTAVLELKRQHLVAMHPGQLVGAGAPVARAALPAGPSAAPAAASAAPGPSDRAPTPSSTTPSSTTPAPITPAPITPAVLSSAPAAHEPAVPGVATQSPFDTAPLSRASRTLAGASSWNGFVPRQKGREANSRGTTLSSAPVSDSRPAAPVRPVNAAPAGPTVPAGEVARPAAVSPPLPRQRNSGGPPSLRRRVPGSQLPADSGRQVLSPPSTPADAEHVRDLLHQFEAGVSRAQREVFDTVEAAVEPEPATRRPEAMVNGLTRRVPGATLAGTATPVQAMSRRPTQPMDPEEARKLIEQFESGVALALREARPHQEGQPR